MWSSLWTYLSGVLVQPWAVVIMGLAVTGLCLMLGRSFFRPRPSDPKAAGDRELAKAVADRRAALRRRGNCVTVDFASPGDPALELSGWVLDRSLGGLCVEVECRLPVGAVLHVRPRNAPAPIPWTDAVVKSCTPDQAGWRLGLQFVRTPSYNVLMLFG